MRDFSNVDAMWADALGQLLTKNVRYQSRVGQMTEARSYQATLADLDRTFLLNPRRALSPQYASVELLWYLSGRRDVEMLVPYAPSYFKYAEGYQAWGAYGWRWLNDPAFLQESQDSPMGQLHAAIGLLREKPHSRQAVVTMWNAGDLPHALTGDKADLPCTLTWQFLHRGGDLHMICTMRSEDAWLGMPYDIYVNTCVQRLVAEATGTEVGTYTHQVGSLHLYSKYSVAATEAIGPRSLAEAESASSLHRHSDKTSGWTPNRTGNLQACVASALHAEKSARLGWENTWEEWLFELRENVGTDNPLHDSACVCAMKWVRLPYHTIRSPLLREAVLLTR